MKRARKRILRKIFLLGVILFFSALVAGGSVVFYFSKDVPSVERISSRRVVESTKIYDRTGTTLLYEISAGQKRTVVPLSEIPQYVKDATIVIEDENFYEEPAVNWRAIMRAFIVNFTHGRIVQGGSTITQQLAKNAFLSPEQTFPRKIKELILAVKLSRHYSKDEILNFYLNEIPYGPTAYGVEAASQAYFNKSVKDVNLAEGALLAALPRAPSYYSPWGSHGDELINRQQYILEKLYMRGKIDEEQLTAAQNTNVVFAAQSRGIKAPHFIIAVQDHLIENYGEELVRTGGLKVTTTLDTELQDIAERVVAEGAAKNEELYNGYNAALVAEDPKTGQILALVGSRDYFATSSLPIGCSPGATCAFEPNFNVAVQGLRQPGSALKPFAYLTAFAKGYLPSTVVFDVPTEFAPNNPSCPIIPNFSDENPDCFHPENFDEQFRGPVTLRQGLGQSINIPSVKVLYLAGLEETLGTIRKFGIRTLTDPSRYGLSLVLGGGEVKLIELVGAYSVLAQEGIRHPSAMILEVRGNDGRTLESYKDASETAFETDPARAVNDILADVEIRAGLFQGSLTLTTFPDYEVALKTGTSNDYRDAWAVGYTPSLVAGVWAGNNDNSPMQRRGSSILAAIPIWNKFMVEALKKFPPETFARPGTSVALKPILGGDYSAGNQVHSILHYIDRRNPTGPEPKNPADDQQFLQWEIPILAWAREHIPDFERIYNQSMPGGGSLGVSGTPVISIHEPTSGAFVRDEIPIRATIASAGGFPRLRVYFNNKLVQEFGSVSLPVYEFTWVFRPAAPALQNLLRLEVVDQSGKSAHAEVIVYR